MSLGNVNCYLRRTRVTREGEIHYNLKADEDRKKMPASNKSNVFVRQNLNTCFSIEVYLFNESCTPSRPPYRILARHSPSSNDDITPTPLQPHFLPTATMSMFRSKKLDLGCFVNIKVIRDHTKRKVFAEHEPER